MDARSRRRMVIPSDDDTVPMALRYAAISLDASGAGSQALAREFDEVRHLGGIIPGGPAQGRGEGVLGHLQSTGRTRARI